MKTQAFPTHEEITARAHAIWEAQGRPSNRELEHWFEAERQFSEFDLKRVLRALDGETIPDPDDYIAPFEDELAIPIRDLENLAPKAPQPRSPTSL